MQTVLVTGGSGFLGAYCIMQLLQKGYHVKTTLRSINRKNEVINMLKNGGVASFDHLEFVEADLVKDNNWSNAVKNCTYVLHVASPFPATVPKDENELIIPAREGTLRVLRASRAAFVQRVVVTSSFAAIGYGYPEKSRVFTEADWTRLDNGIPVLPYQKSKTLAERAAWDFIAREGGGLELAVINPVGILGPLLGNTPGTSASSIQKLLQGMPGVPNISFGIVDVRDVADLHIRAMTSSAAKGERFLAVAGETMSIKAMAAVLKSNLGEAAKRVPERQLPDWLVKVAALFDPTLKSIVPSLGKHPQAINEKAKRLLGWQPRSNEETIIATAKSLLKSGLVKK